MKTENYRILQQIHYFNKNGDRITLNAGEPLPPEALENKQLVRFWLEQETICKVDKDGENVIAPKKDALDREILTNSFVHGLTNPKRITESIEFLKAHHICEDNLVILKAEIEAILKFNPKNYDYKSLLIYVNEQFDEINAAR